MTGPEHYREAERLLAIPVTTDPEDQGAVIALHLAAVAHATLAHAAATAESTQSQMFTCSPRWRSLVTGEES